MTGSQEFLARRFEPIDLLSERFDSSEVDVRQRIFAFAQPRSASFTLCRLLAAAGWGLPVEYFNLQTMEIYWKRFFGSSFAESTDRESIFRYVAELERRRTRNGVFSAKIMWDNTNRFRTAYSIPSAPVRDAHHIYIRRSDFQTQVVSFMVLQATGMSRSM